MTTLFMSELDKGIIKELLEQWHCGIVNEMEVHENAEKLWEEREDWVQYPEHDFRSIAVEVLSHLEILNHQLVTPDDIPTMLTFLNTPLGKELEGWQIWRQYWEQLDLVARKESLLGNPYYSPARESMLPLHS